MTGRRQGAIGLFCEKSDGTRLGHGATQLFCGTTYRPMLGQGATEYLVLLAVVLIVGLVSVSLLGFFPGMASDEQLKQSQTYWSSAARPFQVADAASSGETLCAIFRAHGYILVLQNTEADALTVTGLRVDNSSGFCVLGGVANASILFGPGERKTISVMTSSGDSPCTEQQIVELRLNITYRTAFITDKVQSGEKKLMLRCSTSISAAANATGGNITEVGGYRIHTFTSSGTFTANGSMVVEVLVVAGGGGGGGSTAGGGGGGGVIYGSNYAVSAGESIAVTVGAGGSGSRRSDQGTPNNTNGENSVFGTLTSIGGGYGFSGRPSGSRVANSGGSGGGAGYYSGNDILVSSPGSSTSGQGNSGGTVTANGNWGGAGGGGAGGAGGPNTNPSSTRYGGIGLLYDISGTPTYYGGGGGGGVYASDSVSPGGLGGGGSGGSGSPTIAQAGTANTGGGGGGGGYYQNGPGGGNGGSGIVIVRYR